MWAVGAGLTTDARLYAKAPSGSIRYGGNEEDMHDAVIEILARIDGSARGRLSLKIRTLLGLFGYQAHHRVRAESLAETLAALSAAGVSHHLPSGRRADDYITLARAGAKETAAAPPSRGTTPPTTAAEQDRVSDGSQTEILVPGQEYHVLSLYGPWAWAIVFGGKDVENRSWSTLYRGRILVHASSKRFANENLAAAREQLAHLVGPGVAIPATFPESRIIGSVEVVDCVDVPVDSPWAALGGLHWRLRDSRPVAWDAHVDGDVRLWKWTCPGSAG